MATPPTTPLADQHRATHHRRRRRRRHYFNRPQRVRRRRQPVATVVGLTLHPPTEPPTTPAATTATVTTYRPLRSLAHPPIPHNFSPTTPLPQPNRFPSSSALYSSPPHLLPPLRRRRPCLRPPLAPSFVISPTPTRRPAGSTSDGPTTDPPPTALALHTGRTTHHGGPPRRQQPRVACRGLDCSVASQVAHAILATSRVDARGPTTDRR